MSDLIDRWHLQPSSLNARMGVDAFTETLQGRRSEMSGLELFAIAVIAMLTHLLISIVPGYIFQKDKEDMFMLAWLIGIALFVIVVLLWASGVPFRFFG